MTFCGADYGTQNGIGGHIGLRLGEVEETNRGTPEGSEFESVDVSSTRT